jgi:hypothetical protein
MVAVLDYNKPVREWMDTDIAHGGAAGAFLTRLSQFDWPTFPDDLRPPMVKQAGPQFSLFRSREVGAAAQAIRIALHLETGQ